MADNNDEHPMQEEEEEEAGGDVGFNFAPGVWNELIGEDIQYKVRVCVGEGARRGEMRKGSCPCGLLQTVRWCSTNPLGQASAWCG